MQSLKILFIGNSFAQDTMEYFTLVAKQLGVEQVKFCTLYVGGCSIDMHYEHATKNLSPYIYYTDVGDGWTYKEEYSIGKAIIEDDWDWIAIQHGTKGTSRYTSPECYQNLTPLIKYVKELAPKHTKIAFNMAWTGESTRQHHEIISYNGDMVAMRNKLVEVTKEMVLSNPLVDLLVPTGTAIENARTSKIGVLTRDGFHLSLDKGRFIAGLTFMGCITGLDVSNVSTAPNGVDDYALKVAIESAKNAIENPLEITVSKIN